MKSRIQQWGNSLALRIPKSIAQSIHISANTEVSLELEDNRLVIVVTPQFPTLEDLLNDITPENMHSEISTGLAIGNEAW